MSQEMVAAEVAQVSTRSAVVIAAEIISIKEQTRKIVLYNAIEIGRRLVEAKQYVPHGEWGKWLEEAVDFSQSTANNLMRIFEEYGSNQLSLFGDNAKSETLGNLSYTQAVALLAIPAEEREEFIIEHDAASKSTRELQRLIKEKQELEKQLEESREREEAEKKARELVSKRLDEVQAEKNAQDAKLEQLQQALREAEKSGDAKEVAKLKTEVRKAEKAASDARERIVELQNQLDEKIKQREAELEAQMAEKMKEREQELSAQAQRRIEEAAKEVEAMKEELAKNNNVAAIKVKVRFDTLVEDFKAFLAAVGEVENTEEREKLKGAADKLCDKMKAQLSQL